MTDPWTATASIVSIVSAALLGGVYLAFTSMVMPALKRTGSRDAAGVMNKINVAAEQPGFLSIFALGALSAVAVLLLNLPQLGETAALWRIAGAVLSLFGTLITMVHNVPRNRRLSAEPDFWPRFATEWSRSNLLRGLSSGLGAVFGVLGLL
ncbi:DUF1772 domain-containing protein [Psychromicrobium lacuslunae]|uniref:DUF1772 domain-containing protein n=1 Tax=Psychromicrobium lacuslunae TaxID=1618207 RepID=A0A0D4BVR4_9MICC|nr:anthrone oxygenase family protein [Psychromicrobium lacuslunae]AJT40408.1 hypothetical protein UM93_00485 [Psychromicrobium lacuslunae]